MTLLWIILGADLIGLLIYLDVRRIERHAQGPTGGLFPLFDEHYLTLNRDGDRLEDAA